MTEPLHKQIDTPTEDSPDETADRSQTESKLEHHLAGLETYLSVVQDRIEEVRKGLRGEDVDAIADGGPSDLAVASGRLLEALNNCIRSAGQIYALCSEIVRKRD